MKIKFRKGYILVISEKLVSLSGYLSGVGGKAKGVALFPFIFIKSEEFDLPWLITHERIHFRQQIEALFIGALILEYSEKLYAHFVLKKSWFDAYLWTSGEQEAYLNQENSDYLKTRKPWSQLKYVRNKKKFTLGKPGEVIIQ